MHYELIDNTEKYIQYSKTLKDEGITCISLDIEGEFNLHCYGEHLCLIQIYDGKRKLIIDPFTIDDEQIAHLFSNRDILKIMYSSESDQALIHKKYNTEIKSILDLRPAVTVLGVEKEGLSSVLESFLGITPGRNRQKYNWMKRPIEASAIDYALNDVIHLFTLKEKLFEELIRRKRLDEYLLMNLKIQNGDFQKNTLPSFFKKKQYKKLNNNQKEKAKKIFYIRERYAEKYNLPPHNLLENSIIITLTMGKAQIEEVRLYKKIPEQTKKAIKKEIIACLNT